MSTSAPSEASYDVVVVGARAAGAATAMLLARQGARVLLVDRTRYGADTLSTHALMRAGVLQLARWGLLDRVRAVGTPAVRRTTFRYAHAVVPISIKPAYGVDALYAPRRTVLDPILVDAAIEAGAETRFGYTVTGLLRHPSGAVAGVTGRDGRGEGWTARARLVVGADGLRSTIAQLVDAPYEKRGLATTAVTYGYWSELDTDGYEWNFHPHATSGVIPTNDGQACVYASALPADVGRGGMDVLRRIIAASEPQLAARLDAARAPEAVRTFTGWPGHIRRSWGPGWALVGDAGYFKDPISAHGLTDALRDAELLACRIMPVISGAAREDDTLAAYQADRDALSGTLFDVIELIASHTWTDDDIPDLLLRLSAAMSDEVEALAALDPATTAAPPC
jgi:2-polyprenyl-6-methoxyphenol hydroxylase-like FAD-dependent oxidoreductase